MVWPFSFGKTKSSHIKTPPSVYTPLNRNSNALLTQTTAWGQKEIQNNNSNFMNEYAKRATGPLIYNGTIKSATQYNPSTTTVNYSNNPNSSITNSYLNKFLITEDAFNALPPNIKKQIIRDSIRWARDQQQFSFDSRISIQFLQMYIFLMNLSMDEYIRTSYEEKVEHFTHMTNLITDHYDILKDYLGYLEPLMKILNLYLKMNNKTFEDYQQYTYKKKVECVKDALQLASTYVDRHTLPSITAFYKKLKEQYPKADIITPLSTCRKTYSNDTKDDVRLCVLDKLFKPAPVAAGGRRKRRTQKRARRNRRATARFFVRGK